MVYTALQLISRGREGGISVVDLSKKTGYDPKTCHYVVDKLVELNLMYALNSCSLHFLLLSSYCLSLSEKRKKSGVGANFCIHRYFFERSEIWQDVLAEEGKANQTLVQKTEEPEDDMDMDMEGSTPAHSLGHIHFDPIDSRHLSSLAIIRNRLEMLLRNSPHHMHAAQNLLVTIVCILSASIITGWAKVCLVCVRVFRTLSNRTDGSFRPAFANLWRKV